jgi:hypothetical protein
MTVRVTDFALMIGHAWRCTSCRQALLADPAQMGVGYKLSDTQRTCISQLSDDDFHTIMHLAEVTGLTTAEIDAAIDHPRARLRHLGSVKGEYRPGVSW